MRSHRSFGERCQQLEGAAEVADRFQVGRTLRGAFPCPLVVGDSLLGQAGFIVVARDQLGLDLDSLGELRFKHFGDPRMKRSSRALEQRLVSRILDHRVFEDIGPLGRVLFVNEARIDEFGQSRLKHGCFVGRYSFKQLKGELTPKRPRHAVRLVSRPRACQGELSANPAMSSGSRDP